MSAITVAACADFYGIPCAEVFGPSKARAIVKVRAAIAYILRTRDEVSYPQISKRLGRTDHTTAIHLVRRATDWLEEDETFAELVEHHLTLPKHCAAPPPTARQRERQQSLLDWKPPPAQSANVAAFRAKLNALKPVPKKEMPEQERLQYYGGNSVRVDQNGRDKAELSQERNWRRGSAALLAAINASKQQVAA